jgi:RHS repeat-associated protein
VTQRFFAQGFQRLAPYSSLPASFYYTQDHLGSVREVVDATGTLRARYDYDAWGNRTKLSGDVEADFGFTGHLHHKPTGLILTHYRAYDPRLGRWLSRDPIAENGGINLYGYVSNNPINATDPLGLWTFKVGISVDANAGIAGIPGLSAGLSGTASVGVSISGNFPFIDVGVITETESTGSYTGAGINLSANVGASDACDLQDLEGQSTEIFGDLGLAGPIGGGGLGFGNQRNGNPYLEVNGEVGLGGQSIGGLGGGTQNTIVYSAQGLGNWIGGLFK